MALSHFWIFCTLYLKLYTLSQRESQSPFVCKKAAGGFLGRFGRLEFFPPVPLPSTNGCFKLFVSEKLLLFSQLFGGMFSLLLRVVAKFREPIFFGRRHFSGRPVNFCPSIFIYFSRFSHCHFVYSVLLTLWLATLFSRTLSKLVMNLTSFSTGLQPKTGGACPGGLYTCSAPPVHLAVYSAPSSTNSPPLRYRRGVRAPMEEETSHGLPG